MYNPTVVVAQYCTNYFSLSVLFSRQYFSI